ncbi:MAG: hypothetical protein K2X82_07345 [Gemmataceae bacterium]|nr:hypothetical protein [Gemmataceae bacterium]
MRKLLLALGCMFLVVGLVVAADTVTLVKYDKDTKKVTVKDKDDKEATYTITDKTKVTRIDKDGNKKEGKLEEIERFLSSEKAAGKMKMEIEVKDGKLTEIITKGRGKGKGGSKDPN